MMVKKYSVGRLKEGMILGRDVYKEDMTVLLGEGTVLTLKMIDALIDRNIFSVYIKEDDREEATPAAKEAVRERQPNASAGEKTEDTAAKTVPQQLPVEASEEQKEPVVEAAPKVALKKEKLQDDAYVRQYNEVFSSLKKFYADVRSALRIDAEAVRALAQKFLPLCTSVKAIVQIYDMEVTEEYRLHHDMHVAIGTVPQAARCGAGASHHGGVPFGHRHDAHCRGVPRNTGILQLGRAEAHAETRAPGLWASCPLGACGG